MGCAKIRYKILVEGKITALSGIHIGGYDAGMNLIGSDITVLRSGARNPPEPYIPGSSLKGKLRSLLERARGEFGPPPLKGRGVAGASNDPASVSGKLFGIPFSAMGESGNPTRLIIHDSPLNPHSAEKLKAMKRLERPYTEVKREAAIDRVTATVAPREVERVVEGAVFDMKLVMNIYEDDNAEELTKALVAALNMLNDDYIGGHGSRGYGRVKITINRNGLTAKTPATYEDGGAPLPLSEAAPELEPLFTSLLE